CLLNSIRSNPDICNISVVVVSVKADDAKRELNGGAIGVIDWLSKPIDQPRLIEAVRLATTSDRTPKVLHIEDEPDVHTVIKHMLAGKCELKWTTTVAESETLLKNEHFDLVLLDIGLPDGSGLDLIKVIENMTPPPQIVIFSSYDITKEYINKVNSVLVKSKTSNEDLLKTITALISD
ncbi:MAG: response regulator, partial [Gammaproteobacteria bacterium]|nr:response regulator [Gammaproteobacteria bacterium]